MSIPFSQGKLQGEERKHILQTVQEQAKVAARAAIKPILEAFLEAEVSAKLGRRKGKVAGPMAKSARLTGSVRSVGVPTPIASCATAIIAGGWKRAGVISAIYVSLCWSANSVSMMW